MHSPPSKEPMPNAPVSWEPVPLPEPTPCVERFAATADVPIWYSDSGGDGDAIVLCHPASQSSLIWGYQQAVLADAGYRVIAWCRRGHYKTVIGNKEQPGTTAGDLSNLLDALQIDACHVLGAAAGGIGAMAFAVTQPHRVLSLAIIGSIVAPDEPQWRTLYERLALQSAFAGVPSAHLELGPSYRATNPNGFAHFCALEKRSKPGGRFMQPSGARVTWQTMQALRMPVLLLTGEADLYAPPPLQRLFAQHLRRHKLRTFRETGHASYWERPQEFNAQVLGFLATA